MPEAWSRNPENADGFLDQALVALALDSMECSRSTIYASSG